MTDNKILTLKHGKSGATCQIHAFGATVISYKTGDGQEHLFLSKDAKLDGSKAIRGGIPVVFPIFGPPPASSHANKSTMPQHGYARLNEWTLVTSHQGASDGDDIAATATYTLDLKNVTAGSRGEHNPWSVEQAALDGTDCLLTYDVRLTEKDLTTTLLIRNTGTVPFDFQALLHTYLLVHGSCAQDNSKTFVKGLGGYAITDKVSGDSGHVQSYDDPVVVPANGTTELDQVFIHPDHHPTIHANIAVGPTKQHIRLEAAGQVNDTVTPVSAVVWNPSATKAQGMSDFGNDEYRDMICVEPGLLGHQPLLQPGQEARLSQTLIALDHHVGDVVA
jgi:glucose-6-phosphate 1-epimerase